MYNEYVKGDYATQHLAEEMAVKHIIDLLNYDAKGLGGFSLDSKILNLLRKAVVNHCLLNAKMIDAKVNSTVYDRMENTHTL